MSTPQSQNCPEAVLASIAWYPDQLDDERRGLVESHVAECADCREELAFIQGAGEPEVSLPDADEVYAGVIARIEESEVLQRATSVPARRLRRRRGAFGARPTALAAGIALALLCGAIGALGGLMLGTATPVYETVAEPEPAPAAATTGPSLDVVFRADARAGQVQAALRGIGGQIVSGPTQLGVYHVVLTPGADAAAAAQVLQGEGRGVATFAQPTPR